jgi:hypothetical protein
MKIIKKEDLIENEIYTTESNSLVYIFKLEKDIENCFNVYQNGSFKKLFKYGNFSKDSYVFRKAKAEKKHWLETCIKLDKYVEYSEAMKSFVKKTKEIKPLPWFKVIKVGDRKTIYDKAVILEVQNNEGNQFHVGDSVTPFNGINRGIKFRILAFRYTNDLSNVCAITELHILYGIGIDKIEHYIETKVVEEESLLEKARRSYPVEIKVKKPLFTTEDGIDIFESDKFYVLVTPFNDKDKTNICEQTASSYYRDCKLLTFFTKKKAEEYILINKPCLSLNDIIKNCLNINNSNYKTITESLKQLVKTKINK